MIRISSRLSILESSLSFLPIRSQGPGGQHVNKASTGVQLRFDIQGSGLPDVYQEGLLAMKDQRITTQGIIVIKAQRFRSLEQNKRDSIARLAALIRSAGKKSPRRKPTRPTRASRERRLEFKTRRSRIKSLRGKIDH